MRIFRSQKPEVQEFPHKKLTKNKHFPSKNWHDWVSGTIADISGLKKNLVQGSIPAHDEFIFVCSSSAALKSVQN